MTELEWAERYGQWLDPVRAPNGDFQVRLDRVAELIDTRTAPRGVLAVLLGVLSVGLAVGGSPLWMLLGGARSQLERDQVLAQFLAEAAAAEKTIVEPAETPATYRSSPAPAGRPLLPWYRRALPRRRST